MTVLLTALRWFAYLGAAELAAVAYLFTRAWLRERNEAFDVRVWESELDEVDG